MFPKHSIWTHVVAVCMVSLACAPAAAPTVTPAPAKPAAPTTAPAPAKPTEAAAAKPAAEKPVAKPAPTAAPAKPAAADWKTEWDKVVAAAKQEGKVVVIGPGGEVARKAFARFEAAYPDIKLEYTAGHGGEVVPKLMAERRANKYLLDVVIGIQPFNFPSEEKVSEPLRPALVLPEVLDDKAWLLGGLDAGFADEAKTNLMFEAKVSPGVRVNRDSISESELSVVEQLAEPKWSGKIAWYDPRAPGVSQLTVASWLKLIGEDFARKVLQHQSVVTREGRQQTEWVIRGQYPIGIGITPEFLPVFRQQGLGLSVKPIFPRAGKIWEAGSGSLFLVNGAPHPNAAKVFVNWLLSRDGGLAWAEVAKNNSRRADVPPADPEVLIQPGEKLPHLQDLEGFKLKERAREIASEYIK